MSDMPDKIFMNEGDFLRIKKSRKSEICYIRADLVQPITDEARQAKFWVKQLLQDLPQNRDWLNPDIENGLKQFVKEPK